MCGASRKDHDILEDLGQGAIDRAEKIAEFLAHVVLGRGHPEGQYALRPQDPLGLPVELHGVEPVDLRGERIGQREEDHIVFPFGPFDESASVEMPEMHAGIAEDLRLPLGQVLPAEFDHPRIQFDVLHTFHVGMPQHLTECAADSAADQQNPPRIGMFQQREMDGLLRVHRIARGECEQAVLEKTDLRLFPRQRQIPIDRVLPVEQRVSFPQKPSGQILQPAKKQHPYGQVDAERRPEQDALPSSTSPDPQSDPRGKEIDSPQDESDLERSQMSDEEETDQDPAEACAGAFERVHLSHGKVQRLFSVGADIADQREQEPREHTERTQRHKGGNEHRSEAGDLSYALIGP